MKLLLWPGDFVAGLAGLPEGPTNRQVLCMWTNTVFWGALASFILMSASI